MYFFCKLHVIQGTFEIKGWSTVLSKKSSLYSCLTQITDYLNWLKNNWEKTFPD